MAVKRYLMSPDWLYIARLETFSAALRSAPHLSIHLANIIWSKVLVSSSPPSRNVTFGTRLGGKRASGESYFFKAFWSKVYVWMSEEPCSIQLPWLQHAVWCDIPSHPQRKRTVGSVGESVWWSCIIMHRSGVDSNWGHPCWQYMIVRHCSDV